MRQEERAAGVEELLSIMRRLRDPKGGCPWDLEQDFRSIAPHTVEEAYEVADAIETGDMAGLEGELGDLLLQVVFLTQLAEEQGLFDFGSVVERLNAKLIDRHPHVFGKEKGIRTATEQKTFWEKSKQKERGNVSLGETLAAITKGLPAMIRSLKIQQVVARKGYEFASIADVVDKFDEELGEIIEARDADDSHALEREIGDVLFTAISLAWMCRVDPDQALRETNRTFVERILRVESLVKAHGKNYEDLATEEQERLWEKAKTDTMAERGTDPVIIETSDG